MTLRFKAVEHMLRMSRTAEHKFIGDRAVGLRMADHLAVKPSIIDMFNSDW